MNPLLKKEIRLLLPAWLAVLFLEMGMPWLGSDHEDTLMFAPYFFFFGMVLLAVDSFGREFSLGTFSSLMAQPMERRQIWRTKTSVLLIAATLIFAVYYVSCELRLHLELVNGHSVWITHPRLRGIDFGTVMVTSGLVLCVALTGGLWTALLLRQISSAFWIALLAPVGLGLVLPFLASFIFKSPSLALFYSLAGFYIIFAFWLAHRLFFRAEDAGWTGGVISFSQWRYFDKASRGRASVRQQSPWAALLKKECQLQSISLLGACALLGLHLAVILLRINYLKFFPNSQAAFFSDCFWFLWLVVPLVIGCMAVAEERKLGLAAEQFCLPVSRRRQFVIKCLMTMVSGVLLGGVMPILLEGAASRFGAPSEFFKYDTHQMNEFGDGLLWFQIGILALSAGLAWVGFHASTLARNFLHALSIAIVFIVVGCFAAAGISYLASEQVAFFGLMPMPWMLMVLLSIPALLIIPPWLAYQNFINYQESARLWWRNGAVILATGLFVCLGSAAIYQRPWSVLGPGERVPGPAQFSLANPPTFESGQAWSGLDVRLPDGRVWCDSLANFRWANKPDLWNIVWWRLFSTEPHSDGPRAFIAGSNWVSAATWHVRFWDPNGSRAIVGNLDTVGVRSDGTLWISSEAKPVVWTGARMIQFGSETNWQKVVRLYSKLLLLKTDGTLWQWGTNHFDWNQWRTHWPSVRDFQPQRIGTNSDWREISSSIAACARKQDGSVWWVYQENKGEEIHLERQVNSDPVVADTFSGGAYVAKDGTLWLANRNQDGGRVADRPFVPAGGEHNWVSTATTEFRWVALKKDGSLWQWDLSVTKSTVDVIKKPPTRLDTRNDWVALDHSSWGEVISLAADGSLWLWPEQHTEFPTLLRPPSRPALLVNILATN